jgi:hypothetical protein
MFLAETLRSHGVDAKVLNGDFASVPPIPLKQLLKNAVEYPRRIHNLDDEVYQSIFREVLDFQPDAVGVSVNEGTLIQARALLSGLSPLVPRVFVGGPAAEKVGRGFPTFIGESDSSILRVIDPARLPSYITPTSVDYGNLPIITKDCMLVPPTKPNEFNQIASSRGCPFKCSFCSSKRIWGHVRFYPIEYIKRQLDYFADLYKGQKFFLQFVDDSLFINPTRAEAVISLLRNRRIPFVCDARCDDITPELAGNLQGCKQIKLGVEACSQRMLDAFHKGITVAQAKEAVALLKANGVPVAVYVMLGAPGCTDADYNESLDGFEAMGADWYSLAVTYPFGNSELYDAVKDVFPSDMAGGRASVADPRLLDFWGVSSGTWERALRLNHRKKWIRE